MEETTGEEEDTTGGSSLKAAERESMSSWSTKGRFTREK